MSKKILKILSLMLVCFVTFTNVFAADGLFQVGAYEDIYKLSEQSGIELPFLNIFTNSATYDKTVKHSGISFGQSTIDVNEKLEGMHILFSNDMVTIKGEVENALIYGTNVVIQGKISGDVVILAPTVQILEGAIVEKDVIIVGNNLDIKGTVKGNVIATISEKTNIEGTIENDLRIITQELNLKDETIKGEVYIETNSETASIEEKYPEAVTEALIQTEEENKIDWMGIVTKGITTVIIYSVICILVTRKDNNFVTKAYKKLSAHTVYGLIVSVVIFFLILLLPVVLILLAVAGIGIIAWPILILYVALILFVISTAMLIVGMTIYEAIKAKVNKIKIPAIVLIFTVLYTLAQITFISTYVNMAILLVAMSVVVTMLTKKLPEEVK